MKNSSRYTLTFLAILLAIGAAGAYASLSFFATVKVLIKLGFSNNAAILNGYVSGISAGIYSIVTRAPSLVDKLPNQLQSFKSLYARCKRKSCKDFILSASLGLIVIGASFFNSFFSAIGASLGIDLLAETVPWIASSALGISIFIGIASFIANIVFGSIISIENMMKFSDYLMRKFCLSFEETAERQNLLAPTTVSQLLQALNATQYNPPEEEIELTTKEREVFSEFFRRMNDKRGTEVRIDHSPAPVLKI